MASNKPPRELVSLAYEQANKFTFRSAILRNMIEYQLRSNRGNAEALNACRHYINSRGVCPYNELYRPVRSALDSYMSRVHGSIDSNLRRRWENILHSTYKNRINNKIYAYTLKKVYVMLNQNIHH